MTDDVVYDIGQAQEPRTTSAGVTCTCGRIWHGVTSPPPCPKHGYGQPTFEGPRESSRALPSVTVKFAADAEPFAITCERLRDAHFAIAQGFDHASKIIRGEDECDGRAHDENDG